MDVRLYPFPQSKVTFQNKQKNVQDLFPCLVASIFGNFQTENSENFLLIDIEPWKKNNRTIGSVPWKKYRVPTSAVFTVDK
jgi:hypothetical protein